MSDMRQLINLIDSEIRDLSYKELARRSFSADYEEIREEFIYELLESLAKLSNQHQPQIKKK